MAFWSLDELIPLARCFAEFYLLPDLLDRYADGRRTRTDPDWAQLLDAMGYNADHVEDRFIPDGTTLTEFIAEDAERFCRRIGLIGPRGGLSPAGRRLVRIARVPLEERGEREARELTNVLAEKIQEHYLGHRDLPITTLLQAASAALASHGHAWPNGLNGLLLVEMESLLKWGFGDADEAQRLVHRLPKVRREVIRAFGEDPEVAEGRYTISAVDVADLLAEVHWNRSELALGSDLTVMELRATAMALTFAQLLSQTVVSSPVQVLQPWVGSGNGR